MKIFVTGGCKNGKSTFAIKQTVAISQPFQRWYLATMLPCDAHEWECVHRHRLARRGLGFLTIEQGTHLRTCLHQIPTSDTILLDSVTALLANEMFCSDTSPNMECVPRICDDLLKLLNHARNIVLVSDYIYSDGIEYDSLSETYRQGLATLDCYLAQHCDIVVELCAGIPIVHKGHLL